MSSRIDELLNVANAISRGETPPFQHNECFTAGAFDLLLLNLSSSEAFNLIGELCQRFESVEVSGNGMKGYYNLLTLLARLTNTTEMPNNLQHIIFKHPALSGDLQSWYRC
jgi:hypothetical protein